MSASVRAIRKRSKMRGRIRPWWAMAQSARRMVADLGAVTDALNALTDALHGQRMAQAVRNGGYCEATNRAPPAAPNRAP